MGGRVISDLKKFISDKNGNFGHELPKNCLGMGRRGVKGHSEFLQKFIHFFGDKPKEKQEVLGVEVTPMVL